ncbi:MAG: polysaccharide deacetylase family protein [Patescibacteria group bacterium]|nr:polysaccharide deacetylase family protein [Patescibacteria group bacterium]
MSLRVAYVSIINPKSLRAHVHNSLKTSEALQSSGAEVTFLHPGTCPSDLEDVLTSHRVNTRFAFKFCNAVEAEELMTPGRFKRAIAYLRMYVAMWGHLSRHADEYDCLYYRHHVLVPLALMWRLLKHKPAIFECHYVYLYKYFSQALTRLSVHSARGVVFITDALRRHYGVSKVKSIVAPCHAAENALLPDQDVSSLRRELNLPTDAKLLCYTGTLGATIQGISYEVETMVKVLADLPEEYQSLIIGDKNNSEYLIKLARESGVESRVIIRPWSDRAAVYKYLCASDILLMPRVGVAPGSSPSKMFDYLAVGKPIVAAMTPPVSEVLFDGQNALLVDADKPKEWASAIKKLERDGALMSRITENAKRDSLKYTWANRGKRIKWLVLGLLEDRRSGSVLRRLARYALDSCLGLLGSIKIRLFGTRSAVVLAYHSVGESPWIHAVSPEVFREQMLWLKNNAEVVTLDKLQNNNQRRRKPLVAITFDDGYKDWVDNTLPILNDFGFKATFFISTDFRSVTSLPQEDLTVIAPVEVVALNTSGQEIGSHGHTHVDLSTCDDGTFESEIRESKKILEMLTGHQVKRMSYPKGRYASKRFEKLSEAGYVAAFAGHGSVKSGDAIFALSRVPVYKNYDANLFAKRFYRTLINTLR